VPGSVRAIIALPIPLPGAILGGRCRARTRKSFRVTTNLGSCSISTRDGLEVIARGTLVKIAAIRLFQDRAEALVAAGLAE
jgi:hypothetical protein